MGSLDWVSGVRPTTDPAEEEFFGLPRPRGEKYKTARGK